MDTWSIINAVVLFFFLGSLVKLILRQKIEPVSTAVKHADQKERDTIIKKLLIIKKELKNDLQIYLVLFFLLVVIIVMSFVSVGQGVTTWSDEVYELGIWVIALVVFMVLSLIKRKGLYSDIQLLNKYKTEELEAVVEELNQHYLGMRISYTKEVLLDGVLGIREYDLTKLVAVLSREDERNPRRKMYLFKFVFEDDSQEVMGLSYKYTTLEDVENFLSFLKESYSSLEFAASWQDEKLFDELFDKYNLNKDVAKAEDDTVDHD